MRILLITNQITGGSGKACLRLFDSLKDCAGIEVRLLYIQGESTSGPDIYSLFRSPSDLFFKQIISRPFNWFQRSSFGITGTNYRCPVSTYRIDRHPSVQWADVLNLHWVSDTLDYKSFFRDVKKPVVWTFHDMEPFSGGYHYTIDRKDVLRASEAKIEKYKNKMLQKARYLSIVCPSEWLLACSRTSVSMRRFRHVLIRNTLDIKAFRPRPLEICRAILSLPKDKKIILYVSSNLRDRRKGGQLLANSLHSIDARNHILLTVGTGYSCWPISHQHLGKVVDELLLSILYSAADACIIPSMEDNLPNVLLESLACGCPVVCLPAGGTSELVDSTNGIIADSMSPDALYTAINLSLSRDWDREGISRSVTSIINPVSVANNYIHVFREALDKTR